MCGAEYLGDYVFVARAVCWWAPPLQRTLLSERGRVVFSTTDGAGSLVHISQISPGCSFESRIPSERDAAVMFYLHPI